MPFNEMAKGIIRHWANATPLKKGHRQRISLSRTQAAIIRHRWPSGLGNTYLQYLKYFGVYTCKELLGMLENGSLVMTWHMSIACSSRSQHMNGL